MVVCRCRKATKLYCFVHKVPVCGECISFADHRLCVVKTYSDWVIDGDYDWPPKCGLCQEVLQESDDVTRLGCFHILHSGCLEKHLRSFPPHTAPAGYTCPTCTTPIWPPKLVRDSNSVLHTKLKEVISQSGLASTLLGSDLNVQSTQKPAPPAFSSSPLVSAGSQGQLTAAEENAPTTSSVPGAALPEADNLNGGHSPSIGEVTQLHESASHLDSGTSSSTGAGSSSLGSTPAASHFTKAGPSPTVQLQNGAMARKNSMRGDVLNSPASGYDDDEDGGHRKYSRRGPLHHQVLRSLVPFWSPALPTLPVTNPAYEDKHSPRAEDLIDGRPRRKHRHAVTFDTRKLLLWFAIISCMATVLLLYYRLAQDLGNTAVSTQAEQR
ncbi:unnamed protein product [Calypogeia fissa]